MLSNVLLEMREIPGASILGIIFVFEVSAIVLDKWQQGASRSETLCFPVHCYIAYCDWSILLLAKFDFSSLFSPKHDMCSAGYQLMLSVFLTACCTDKISCYKVRPGFQAALDPIRLIVTSHRLIHVYKFNNSACSTSVLVAVRTTSLYRR